ncbi:Rubrerythrin-1 [Koleobacter methoxysyntrophicus]|uniref:Rubrerythrin-1 n=1 Tax=Koleobacter methoxysyntrophicus TaxID=2751313 RepID=A0A8A0RLW7_9FIRM|nr:rubrerythrin family protein [Koleobacter methoxysyntrophicus]QSQ08610.1 Rubrerythrin-1 [Koleobacter methoxysyntrophicus]
MSKKTIENLKKAFEGESQARNKYSFFAEVAKKAGLLEIAEFFEETAENERYHAKMILRLLKGIGDTKENLKAAIDGETYEYKDMYPEFEKIAREEGELEAADFFKKVQNAEKSHAEHYKALLEKLEKGTLYKTDKSVEWKCRVCGYIYEGNEPPAECPLCKHPKEFYYKLSH